MPGTAHATLLRSAPITNVRTNPFRRFIAPPLTSRHYSSRLRQTRCLPVEQSTSRTVATVNLRVAILAGPNHRSARTEPWEAGVRTMPHSVALPAQPWAWNLKRELVDGAVRLMTVIAVLAHRSVLEQERPALLGMARVANVVDRIFLQQRLGVAAVRIMTIRAHDLAFAHRHV